MPERPPHAAPALDGDLRMMRLAEHGAVELEQRVAAHDDAVDRFAAHESPHDRFGLGAREHLHRLVHGQRPGRRRDRILVNRRVEHDRLDARGAEGRQPCGGGRCEVETH